MPSLRDVFPFSAALSDGSLLIAVIMTITMLCPLTFWLYNGWASKQGEIFAALSTEAKNKYLTAFQNELNDSATADDRFVKFYQKWYGRRHYILPVAIVCFVTFYISISLGDTAQYYLYDTQGGTRSTEFYRLPAVAAAALAGAYVFVTYDFIIRASRRDMTSHDVTANALRLVGCIPVGYALAGLAAQAVGSLVAFAVGVFPLSTVSSILRKFASKQLSLDDAAATKNEKVVQLSGIDEQIAERLFEADISTIAQLAYCDPIQLTMRSNLDFNFVIDIVSEALAWIYVADGLDKIRTIGLRGAIEIRVLSREYRLPEGVEQQRVAAAVIAFVAQKLDLSVECVLNAIHEIADDSTTAFLEEVYNRGSISSETSAGSAVLRS